MQWDLNAENTLQPTRLHERIRCSQTYTSDEGEGVCREAEDAHAPTREHSRSNSEVKNLNSPYISSQSSKWREAQIEKSYLLFQAVSITNTKMPCPFPQSPVQWEVEQGTWTAIKEPLEQWTELLRTGEQRNESTQVL